MKIKKGKGKYADNVLVTMRVTPQEKERLKFLADASCQSVSDYLRRRFFGGRPPLAFSDLKTVAELQRIGGLLKHNYETLRQAKSPSEIFALQDAALRQLIRTTEKLALAIDRRQQQIRQERAEGGVGRFSTGFDPP